MCAEVVWPGVLLNRTRLTLSSMNPTLDITTPQGRTEECPDCGTLLQSWVLGKGQPCRQTLQKPTFPDTCSNPWWNVSEKMQEKFLKYISPRPQYIPYAWKLSGREPGVCSFLWSMFLSHTGEILIRGLPDSWKEFKRKCKVWLSKRNQNRKRT